MCFTSTTANNSGQDGCGDCACVKERCGRQACIATHLIPPSSSHALACCCTALARQDMGFDPEMSELYADSSECCRNHSRTSCSVCICFACLCVYVCVCVCVCVCVVLCLCMLLLSKLCPLRWLQRCFYFASTDADVGACTSADVVHLQKKRNPLYNSDEDLRGNDCVFCFVLPHQ